MPAAVRNVLTAFTTRVRGELGSQVTAIRLFGSHARGETSEDSDIDVLVLLREVDFERKKQILDVAGDLWADTGLLVSPVVIGFELYHKWRRQERPLVMAIEREGTSL